MLFSMGVHASLTRRAQRYTMGGSCARRRFPLQTCEDMVAGGVGITTLYYYRKEVDEFVLMQQPSTKYRLLSEHKFRK